MALVNGTNCGFVLTAPTEDPGASNFVIDAVSGAMKAVAPAGAVKVTEIGWWCDNASEAANFEVGIYGHNPGDNNPEAVVGWDQTNAKGTNAGWKKCSGLDIAIVAGTTYWIAVQVDATATATNMVNQADAAEKEDFKGAQTALTDPWGVSAASYAQLTGFYALYEVVSHTATKKSGALSCDPMTDDDSPGLYE
jgi:hypothetical protein